MIDMLFANNNKNVMKHIANKCFKANKTRNVVAITAIFLTTLLFTSVFTVAGVVLHAAEQQSFRQSGGYAHGSFKDISPEDVEVLRTNPLIKTYGLKKMLGLMADNAFAKNPTEVNYCDKTYAELTNIEFLEGSLPRENTMELACNRKVLQVLGIEPKVGSEITLTYEIDKNRTVTDTFTLSGYWQSEEVLDVSFVYLPLSYVDKILAEHPAPGAYAWRGRLDMDIYLNSDAAIHDTMLQILEESGFQNQDPDAENYRSMGVNWAYNSARMNENLDAAGVLFILVLVLLFMFSGILIIYNLFRISVVNDIQFYGLLKTIGTTSRQIKNILYRQSMLLCAIGIPLGLLGGFVTGHVVAPIFMQNLDIGKAELTIKPSIFIGSALLTWITVWVSCKNPARMAGRVSPIEAVRYTEAIRGKKKKRKARKSNLCDMALANIARNKSKTAMVALSLSLSILVLQVTVSLTNGFDMDKYLSRFAVSDFLVGNVNYLNHRELFNAKFALTEEDIHTITSQEAVTDFGAVYGCFGGAYAFYNREHLDEYLSGMAKYNSEQAMGYTKKRIECLGTNEKKESLLPITMYGMDDFALEKINVFEGSMKGIQAKKGIIAVYRDDNYGNPKMESNDKQIGDTITIRMVGEWAYFDIVTDELIDDIETYEQGYYSVPVSYTDETYEVVALATMKYNMGYRYGGNKNFILPTKSLKEATIHMAPMNVLLEVEDESAVLMERFLEQYTTQISSSLDFESRQQFADAFYSFQNSYRMIGILLSSLIGMVGMLNFFNVILTSITVRKREFAMLQSIGMTGKQLKTMLICEGLWYIVITMLVTVVLTGITLPMFESVVSRGLWFFSSDFTIVPMVVALMFYGVIGIATPVLVYRVMMKHSIVERIRE